MKKTLTVLSSRATARSFASGENFRLRMSSDTLSTLVCASFEPWRGPCRIGDWLVGDLEVPELGSVVCTSGNHGAGRPGGRAADQDGAIVGRHAVEQGGQTQRRRARRRRSWFPTTTTLSPGRKEQQSAYPHSNVRMHACVRTFHILREPLAADASILSSELSDRARMSVRCPGSSTASALV